jgi:hypothetical protein
MDNWCTQQEIRFDSEGRILAKKPRVVKAYAVF